MARFHFHLFEPGALSVDGEGCELASRDDAEAFAIRAARDVMSQDVLEGRLSLGSYLRILNVDTGDEFEVQFRDVVAVTDKRPDQDLVWSPRSGTP